MSSTGGVFLEGIVADIEGHVGSSGWDQRPALFALVGTSAFEQEALSEGPLDEVLAQIAWPADVDGCALSQEIVLLPPGADAELDEHAGPQAAMAHPDRREARLVVAVLRDGTSAAVLRLRDVDDLLTGADLAPNLVEALHATLH